MKHIFFSFEEDKYWIEIDDEGYANRQIIFSEGEYHVSALEDCLAEDDIDESDIDADVVNISEADFELAWNKALERYKPTWGRIKDEHKINDTITARLAYFYPQGAIFKKDDISIRYAGDKETCLNDELTMKIIGYDDVNMWLVAQ